MENRMLNILGWSFGIIAIIFSILTTISFTIDLTFGLITATGMFFFGISSFVMFASQRQGEQDE